MKKKKFIVELLCFINGPNVKVGGGTMAGFVLISCCNVSCPCYFCLTFHRLLLTCVKWLVYRKHKTNNFGIHSSNFILNLQSGFPYKDIQFSRNVMYTWWCFVAWCCQTCLYASFLKGHQGHQCICSLVKGTLWENCQSTGAFQGQGAWRQSPLLPPWSIRPVLCLGDIAV